MSVDRAPITTEAYRRFRVWRAEWQALGSPTLPVVLIDGAMLSGLDAVRRLGKEIVYADVEVNPELGDPRRYPAVSGRPSPSWVSQIGGRWRNIYHVDPTASVSYPTAGQPDPDPTNADLSRASNSTSPACTWTVRGVLPSDLRAVRQAVLTADPVQSVNAERRAGNRELAERSEGVRRHSSLLCTNCVLLNVVGNIQLSSTRFQLGFMLGSARRPRGTAPEQRHDG